MNRMHTLMEIYQTLFEAFGPQDWWPGETPFEVMVGAVLTQNTNWRNVSRAIAHLKGADLLSLEALTALPTPLLADKIRPAGYYNLKADRLKNLLHFINREYQGDLEAFFGEKPETLRQGLLSVRGIGPETADSIILYGAHKPVFVVDAYTYRILFRHGLISEEAEYHDIQELFQQALPASAALFNEYHALLVRLGKEFCKKNNPLCTSCPIEGI
jgi:endonuclease-3 related protein